MRSSSALVERGDRVVAIDRVPVERGDVTAYALDLADADAVAGALADAEARGLRIEHVVAIAGAALPEEKTGADVADLPLEVFRASLELNLVTAWITLRAALPHLRRADGDRSDHAHDVHGCPGELRPARLRGGQGRPDRSRALARGTARRRRHPHQRRRARRRADAAQRA